MNTVGNIWGHATEHAVSLLGETLGEDAPQERKERCLEYQKGTVDFKVYKGLQSVSMCVLVQVWSCDRSLLITVMTYGVAYKSGYGHKERDRAVGSDCG